MAEVGLAMMEGARKYGKYNWRRAGVRASVYIDAAMRHLTQWQEGENIDPDSGINHITKAIASLTVLRDSMMHGNFTDDRPEPSEEGWMNEFNDAAAALLKKYPTPHPDNK
jgi:hypothetical protein